MVGMMLPALLPQARARIGVVCTRPDQLNTIYLGEQFSCKRQCRRDSVQTGKDVIQYSREKHIPPQDT